MEPLPPTATDGELVAASLRGCGESFETLFRRYQSALLRVARSRLGDAGRAEDAVQEAFLNAHRWLASYDSRYSFRTWLWTILLNVCKRNRGRLNRTPSVRGWSDRPGGEEHATPTDPADEHPSPPALLLERERAELLERSLGRLPEREADALRLRFHGGLKFREIADTMQCSLGTAKNRVRNGLVKLAEIVTETEALAEAAGGTFDDEER